MPIRRTFEQALQSRTREVCLANAALKPVLLRTLREKFWRRVGEVVSGLVIAFVVISGGLFFLAAWGRVVFERGSTGPTAAQQVSLWQLMCLSGMLGAVALVAATDAGDFSARNRLAFFLPQSDERLFRRWWARWEVITALIGSLLCAGLYGLIMVLREFSVLQGLAGAVCLLVEALVVPSAAVVIRRFLPRQIQQVGWQLAGIALFGVWAVLALLLLFSVPIIPALSYAVMAVLPAGWPNLAFQQALVEHNAWGWLWLVPVVGLILVARRWERAPLEIEEFEFLSAADVVPKTAPECPWFFAASLKVLNAVDERRPVVTQVVPKDARGSSERPTAATLRAAMELPTLASMPGIVRLFGWLLSRGEQFLFRALVSRQLGSLRYWWMWPVGYAVFVGLIMMFPAEPRAEPFRITMIFAPLLTLSIVTVVPTGVLNADCAQNSHLRQRLDWADCVPISFADLLAMRTKGCLFVALAFAPVSLALLLCDAWLHKGTIAAAMITGLKVCWVTLCGAWILSHGRVRGRLRPPLQALTRMVIWSVAGFLVLVLAGLGLALQGIAAAICLASLALLCLAFGRFEKHVFVHWEWDLTD